MVMVMVVNTFDQKSTYFFKADCDCLRQDEAVFEYEQLLVVAGWLEQGLTTSTYKEKMVVTTVSWPKFMEPKEYLSFEVQPMGIVDQIMKESFQ